VLRAHGGLSPSRRLTTNHPATRHALFLSSFTFFLEEEKKMERNKTKFSNKEMVSRWTRRSDASIRPAV
jgi:hypothetical protein